ncbi:MAG: HAD-IA family hydrolase [Oceanobacter sp.]
MKFELVVFDWDGTLADSTDRIVDSMRTAAEKVGMPTIPDSSIQNIIGLGLPEALQTLWPAINADQMELMREAYARNFVSDSPVEMKLFDGARELLDALLNAGVKIAVATGKSRKGLDRILKDLDMTETFHITRCADETRSKPDPLMLKQILTNLDVTAEKAVMIGDTTYDLDMGSSAGMSTLAMSHGAHDEPLLMSRNPLAILHSITELKHWLFETH